jgi:hypothetical protein
MVPLGPRPSQKGKGKALVAKTARILGDASNPKSLPTAGQEQPTAADITLPKLGTQFHDLQDHRKIKHLAKSTGKSIVDLLVARAQLDEEEWPLEHRPKPVEREKTSTEYLKKSCFLLTPKNFNAWKLSNCSVC